MREASALRCRSSTLTSGLTTARPRNDRGSEVETPRRRSPSSASQHGHGRFTAVAEQIGGSVSGYLHSATPRWPPGSPGYGPNVWSADLNIHARHPEGSRPVLPRIVLIQVMAADAGLAWRGRSWWLPGRPRDWRAGRGPGSSRSRGAPTMMRSRRAAGIDEVLPVLIGGIADR
jgi:hypothetical protein